MVLVEAAVAVGLVGFLVYTITSLLLRPPDRRRPASRSGRWHVAHYDAKGETHVVLQKISAGGTEVLDEHVVAVLDPHVPDYDDRFLAAMDTARRRQALFEVEDQP